MLIEQRRSHRLMNQINVVPYIDVMLVLLVIFMVTAPLVNPGQIERLDNRYHTFAEELIGILDRGLRSGTR